MLAEADNDFLIASYGSSSHVIDICLHSVRLFT